ncbi:MAG: nucleoside deaminase [Acetobacteraceae bacterium]|nr:MAG: nucleoside deaminase [Acetobacteraceae bacterium]
MEAALQQARRAALHGDVPVGAVMLHEGDIIARAGNVREAQQDPVGHAEMLVLRAAAGHLGRWRLGDCTLVCTLEPCPMCAGALINARLGRLVYGARDPRAGAAGTCLDILGDRRLNHRVEVVPGVMAPTCAAMLQAFFAGRRGPRGL